jgi:hypothetical protein
MLSAHISSLNIMVKFLMLKNCKILPDDWKFNYSLQGRVNN